LSVPEFAFATCLIGLEPALKLDVAQRRPALRFAYSRPGMVTFKASGAVTAGDEPGSVFAHVWGRSIGAARDAEAAQQLIAPLAADRLHVFARDPEVETELAPWTALDLGGIPVGGAARDGELVADVIVGAAGEPVWIGAHRHDPSRPAHPGGAIPVDVPPAAPSRAYAKIEEAIAWARIPIAAGQVALEIGAAPGGAALALASRGLDVWAVDPGDLAPHIAALSNVHHLAIKVGALRWEQLPPRIDWLLVDVNLAPQVALHEVARLIPRLRTHLRGAVITLKLNDWEFVGELPAFVERIRQMGLPDVRLRHLPSNRRELCAVALR
jgi:23S rRNA (cytidine2498-2'-O)-methyltransferase